MATYVVGDLQGCLEPLLRLLDLVGYCDSDRIWLAGDLVNRGPDSLGVLRWAMARPAESLVAVLGNHDLNLLCVAEGLRKPKRLDTLSQVLSAPDRDELLGWLRERPLTHRRGGWFMVHAGLLPSWDLEQAEGYARALEATLRGPAHRDLLAGQGDPQLQAALQVLVRLRLVDAQGLPNYKPKGPPADAPPDCVPWYEAPDRRWAGQARILFGHWSTLGLWVGPEAIGLDTGCVWGRELTCVRLEDERLFRVSAG
jgi:bis(5'-nucleosyl)-tetraphosphatase (symmetrical)